MSESHPSDAMSDIHPLALENMLQTRRHDRSKADYFRQHLFIRVLRHTLVEEEPDCDDDTSLEALEGIEIPRSASPSPIEPGEQRLASNGHTDDVRWSRRRSLSVLGSRMGTAAKKMAYPPPEAPEPSMSLQRTLSFNTHVTVSLSIIQIYCPWC